jgi:hypothetical protein
MSCRGSSTTERKRKMTTMTTMTTTTTTTTAARARAALSATLLLALATVGCIGVSRPRVKASSKASAGSPPISATVLARAGVKVCAGGLTRPADDGDLDDFEDRNNQLTPLSGRDGYWWTKKDDKGSTVEPKVLGPSPGGAGGSSRAMHVWGHTASGEGAWGAGVGVNLSTHGPYDAERYAGISFKAKIGADSTRNVRFKIGDINTHQDGGVCKFCWNHFGKDLELTTEWQEYKILFANVKQEEGWGSPRPPAVLPGQLISIDWSIGTGLTYDLWIDDITFLDCQ